MFYLSIGLTPQPNPGVQPLILLLLSDPATPALLSEKSFPVQGLSLLFCDTEHPARLTPRWTVADSVCGDTWLFPAILEVRTGYEFLPCPALVKPRSTGPAAQQPQGHLIHLEVTPQSHNQHVLGTPTC